MKSLKIILFCIVVLAGFAGYSNFGVPQVKPELPPAEEKFDIGNITMEQFVALGEKIFNGKGACTLCHSSVLKRAPVLDGHGDEAAANIATLRLKDKRYRGKATTPEEYIRESMIDPSAYVVAGFGSDNDTRSPMPDVRTGVIGLSEPEIDAVIAYMQKRAGVDITVRVPSGALPLDVTSGKMAPAKTAEEVIAKFGCGNCHKIGKEEGALGPDLTHASKLGNEAYIRRGILDPDADISKNCSGSPCLSGQMPTDYGTKMTGSELEMLVQYLVKSK